FLHYSSRLSEADELDHSKMSSQDKETNMFQKTVRLLTMTAMLTTTFGMPSLVAASQKGTKTSSPARPLQNPATNQGSRVMRVTNVRTNANGIGGGSASGAIPVQASNSTEPSAEAPKVTNAIGHAIIRVR